METQSKPLGKTVTLPETEKDDLPIETDENVRRVQDLARGVSLLTVGLFEAKTEKNK